VIGIITKDYFFKFMKTAHDMLWKFNWDKDGKYFDIASVMYADFILLMSGMDKDLAHYLGDYLAEHEELNVDQLDMLFDYFTSDEIIEN